MKPMKRIELQKILQTKNPGLAKWTPKFVITWLENLICAKKINYVLDNYYNLEPIEFIEKTLEYIGVTYTLHNIENIPDSAQKVTFAANHPLGGLDGLILAHGLATHFPSTNIKLIVNDILMNLEPLAPIFVPVNKHGSQNSTYARAQKELYASGDAIITFPAGLCSRLIEGEITDPEWKRNFLVKATENSRTIIPTYIAGHNSRTFYMIAKWRKMLHIKINIEMILLPREMFAQRGKHIDIYFGQAVNNADSSVETIREETYRLSDSAKK